MSVFSFDAHRELFAKTQSRSADCFNRQFVPVRLHSCFRIC